MKSIIAVIIMSVLLSGCGLFQEIYQDDPILVEFGVKSATSRILANNPTWKPEAATITAEAMKFLDEGQVTTIPELKNYVIAEIDWNTLTLEEQELLFLLIERIEERLIERFEEEGTEGWKDQKLAVKTVLSWINKVASREL